MEKKKTSAKENKTEIQDKIKLKPKPKEFGSIDDFSIISWLHQA